MLLPSNIASLYCLLICIIVSQLSMPPPITFLWVVLFLWIYFDDNSRIKENWSSFLFCHQKLSYSNINKKQFKNLQSPNF
jgi:hypothetical protein